MTWMEISIKYEDTESMKEFNKYLTKYMFDEKYVTDRSFYFNIKDIWGYLICFAETKGYGLSIFKNNMKWFGEIHLTNPDKLLSQKVWIDAEKAMLWCAEKFFEVAK